MARRSLEEINFKARVTALVVSARQYGLNRQQLLDELRSLGFETEEAATRFVNTRYPKKPKE